jgi:plastocyanin
MTRLIATLQAGISMVLLLAAPLSAQTLAPPSEMRIEELERRIQELESRLRELEAAAPKPLPALAVTSSAVEPPFAQQVPSLGPPRPSDESSTVSRTGPVSGYMDFHLNRPEHEDAQLDFHRFVLLFNHSFSDRLRFVGELELEHAFVSGLEASGEVELEQAYLDFRVKPELNFRAGMLLAPVGIINERHEPPAFNGVERPFVDTFIIPTTWFDAGAGVHGTLGAGWQYRAYLMAPLDSTRITAEEGLHEATQKGFVSNVRNVATTGRLEYVGVPGLNAGASFWRGKTGFNFRRGDSRVGLFEFDGRYRARRVRAGLHRWRGRFERSVAADDRRESEYRAADAWLLRRALDPASAVDQARRGGVRPLRELRHAVQDAGRRAPLEAVRPRRLGVWRRVLSGSRRRFQDRLLDHPESKLPLPERRQSEHRSRLVVLMKRTTLLRAASLAGAALLVVLASPSGFSQEPTVIRVTAERFTFTPSHIKVKRGTIVEIRLRSEDTNHGFHIVGSEFNTIIPKRGRGEATLLFRADNAGRYTFECSKMCGAGHTVMRGTMIVEE